MAPLPSPVTGQNTRPQFEYKEPRGITSEERDDFAKIRPSFQDALNLYQAALDPLAQKEDLMGKADLLIGKTLDKVLDYTKRHQEDFSPPHYTDYVAGLVSQLYAYARDGSIDPSVSKHLKQEADDLVRQTSDKINYKAPHLEEFEMTGLWKEYFKAHPERDPQLRVLNAYLSQHPEVWPGDNFEIKHIDPSRDPTALQNDFLHLYTLSCNLVREALETGDKRYLTVVQALASEAFKAAEEARKPLQNMHETDYDYGGSLSNKVDKDYADDAVLDRAELGMYELYRTALSDQQVLAKGKPVIAKGDVPGDDATQSFFPPWWSPGTLEVEPYTGHYYLDRSK
jgi:hypothetical protein